MQLRPASLEADQAALQLTTLRRATAQTHAKQVDERARASGPCNELAQLWAIKGDASTSISKKFDKYLVELTQLT